MTKSPEPARPAGFLNVDLDIYCATGIEELVAALEDNMLVLICADGFASLEILDDANDPSVTIAKIARIIEALPPNAQEIWDAAKARVLNIGVNAGTRDQQVYSLSFEAIEKAVTLRARIDFTVYGDRAGARS